jgi:hypothetical protein
MEAINNQPTPAPKTVHVGRKSDLSKQIDHFTTQGNECHRTRLVCDCAKDNRRDGALVLNGKNLVAKVVKCKSCLRQTTATPSAQCEQLKRVGEIVLECVNLLTDINTKPPAEQTAVIVEVVGLLWKITPPPAPKFDASTCVFTLAFKYHTQAVGWLKQGVPSKKIAEVLFLGLGFLATLILEFSDE